MSHRVAEIHVNDLPSVAFKLVTDHPMEVLVVDGIVGAEGGGIIVVDDRLVGIRRVVGAEAGKAKPLETRCLKYWSCGLKICYMHQPMMPFVFGIIGLC